jgi:hypothetical protein
MDEQRTAYRLIYPAKFGNEAQAKAFARSNDLEQTGVNPVREDRQWLLVLDSNEALMLAPWMKEKYPHVTWIVRRLPQKVQVRHVG